ncbi:MAG TPA: hypothetical protein VHA11_08060 [Bryobacteraceae bacterium]|nr:hypothetical protein [Bryobacteraceae bacterium]
MSTKRFLGRWLLYGACLAPALVMLGYYVLEQIPRQREYFMNLRFRALAVIGDQLRSKVERLATSLEYATKSDSSPGKYIAALVPELNYLDRPCQPVTAPSLEFGNPAGVVRFHARQGCAAEASLPKIVARIVADDLFDDVLLADAAGRTIYQRSPLSPKIISLAELLKTPAESKAAAAESRGLETDAVRTVRLDESDYVVLLQPVVIAPEGMRQSNLTVCALVRADRLAEESRHVPPLYLLGIFTPLVVIFLSGPFLKIVLLTRTGRLAFGDLALLTLCTLIAGGLATLLLASWQQYSLAGDQSEPDLPAFANALNQQIGSDVKTMRDTLEAFDAALPADLASLPLARRDRQDLLGSGLPPGADSRFDFVFWTNANGCQVAKWTIRRFNTQRVDQKSEQHFRNVAAGNLWFLDGRTERPFTLQTLISPTTSQLIVVMALPSRHSSLRIDGCGDSERSPVLSAAIVAPLPAVSSPLVPPGAGFAVFEPSGRVLFHSVPERNLHENLFEEIRSPAGLRAAVAMRAAHSEPAYYRGRKFQFHIQPVTGLGGIPWHIAVFRELEPRRAMIGLVWGETLILLMALLCELVLVFFLISLLLRARGLPWRCQIDVFLTVLWPLPARRPIFRRLAWTLAAMALLSLLVVGYALRSPYQSAGWLLPFCYLLPLAAVAVAVFPLRKSEPGSWDIPPAGQRQPAYMACLTLLLVLLSVIPTVGFFGTCQAFEARLHLMHWQQCLMKSMEARRTRLAAAVMGSPALTGQAKAFLHARFLGEAGAASGWDRQNYMASFWSSTTAPVRFPPHAPETSWWQNLLAAIRPETEGNALETGALARDPSRAGTCAWDTGSGAPARLSLQCTADAKTSVEITSTLPAIGLPADPYWWLVAFALLAAAFAWNCLAFRRLYMLDFCYTSLPLLTDLPVPASTSGHILLLGLPLARKDGAVRKWLGYTPARVNLYATRFTPHWLKQTTVRLGQELTATCGAVAQAAAAGSGSIVAPAAAAVVHPWVHISNLEAKLGDPHDREVVANLLERLVLMDVAGMRVRLIVTSAVDPVFHFDSVLSDERKKIYEHPLPEPELQRLARLLHNFRKAQVAAPDPPAPDWAAGPAGRVIYDECRHHHALLEVGAEVAAQATDELGREALLAMVAERARALYKMFWFCCTRSEKLLLIQLAQTGLFNPLCTSTLEELVRKGLILPGPRPRIMNTTFRRFLQSVEGPDTVREWEREAGESSWLVIRNVVLGLIILGLIVMALTQHQAMQTVTAVVTGVGTATAGLLRLTGFLAARRAGAGDAQSSLSA